MVTALAKDKYSRQANAAKEAGNSANDKANQEEPETKPGSSQTS